MSSLKFNNCVLRNIRVRKVDTPQMVQSIEKWQVVIGQHTTCSNWASETMHLSTTTARWRWSELDVDERANDVEPNEAPFFADRINQLPLNSIIMNAVAVPANRNCSDQNGPKHCAALKPPTGRRRQRHG